MKGAQKMTFRDFTSVVDYRTREANGGPSRVDPSPFAGTWVNTNDSAPHRIAKLAMTVRDGILMVHVWGYCTPDPCDWGEVEAHVFADRPDSRKGAGFGAHYDTGSIDVAFQVNMNLGLLVLLTFNRFKDGSSRANYINREFFHR